MCHENTQGIPEMIQTEIKDEFPKSIEGFGYRFNEEGQLRDIETNEGFEFYVKPDDNTYNQTRYERLGGTAIGEYIENELVSKYNLKRQIIPLRSDDDKEEEEEEESLKSRIYLSEDALECQNLLLIIQGSGVVRPGQWARRVIINDCLEVIISVTLRVFFLLSTLHLGTMFPYIQKAQDLNWGIIVFNPNENFRAVIKDGEVIKRVYVRGSESPQKHSLESFLHQFFTLVFLSKAKAEKILIMGYSFGGINITCLLDEFADEFKSRVAGVALADSVHSISMIPSHSKSWFDKNVFNWIKSELPLNMKVPNTRIYYGCPCLSAGHSKHEYAAGTAIQSIFEYLQHVLEKKSSIQNEEPGTDKESMEIGETEKTGEMEGIEKTNETKNTEETGEMEGIEKTNETKNTEETEETEKTNETEKIDGMKKTDEPEKIDEPGKTDETGKTDDTDKKVEMGKTDEMEKTNEMERTDEMEKTNEMGKTDEMEEVKEIEKSGDKNKLE
ncbi:23047_t:CDS:10 [Cetraspora pellucida]|uniref:23047_t:CDS:1 n=1 Tax=Cetraspora pellucida TaxID=1433469 RepID=A0A9N9AXX8_9GLOM|nr:23047_t:CDS:10 [Cetraspora pellucida]